MLTVFTALREDDVTDLVKHKWKGPDELSSSDSAFRSLEVLVKWPRYPIP